MRKTSVYLDAAASERLAAIARIEDRAQADVIRDAINAYEPSPTGSRDFHLARGFERIDTDPRPISEIPEHELLEGFGH